MKWFCRILVVLLFSSPTFAQSNIRVLKRNGGGLTDVTGTAEGVVNNTSRTAIIKLGRDVLVKPILADGNDTICTGVYRITPNDLKCKFVAGEPATASFAHYFELEATPQGSAADIGVQGGTPGHDNLLNNNDFIVFINYYFAHNPLADIGVQGGLAGSDGLWNNNDFVLYNNIFFAGLAFTPGSCSLDGPASPVPFELPEGMATGDPVTDTQLNALWIALSRTADGRIVPLLVDTMFGSVD